MKVTPDFWITPPDEHASGLLQVTAFGGYEIPCPVETHNVAVEDVTLKKEQEFDILLEGSPSVEIFDDENDYDKRRKHKFAPESFIPSGLFSAVNDSNFVQNSTVIITGKIIETYDNPTQYGLDPDDIPFTMSCLGEEINGLLHGSFLNGAELKAGNYVSGTFWVEGWPEEEDEDGEK